MLFVLGAYVALQLALGLWVARRVKSEDDYLLAGRSLGPVLATASMFATWFGAESCVGAAGAVYRDGVGWSSVEPFGYGLCLVLMGLFFAARCWRTGITTLPDLFRTRFGPSTERLAAVLLIPASVLWAAAQVRAFGHVLDASAPGWFGVQASTAIAAGVVIVYCAAGGLLADVITDVVQGSALVLGLLALLAAVVWQLGGLGAATDALAEANALRAQSPSEAPGFLAIADEWVLVLVGSMLSQEALSRSLAARSPGLARNAAVAGGLVYVLVGVIPVTLGLLGPRLLPGLEDGEQLLPRLAAERMPWFVHALFAGALVSAILSTVDSCLLAASSLFAHNLVLRGRPAPERSRLRLARAGAVLAGLAAWGLAANVGSVSELVAQASGFGSAGVFLLAVLGLFGRRGGAFAANACLLAGASTWVALRYALPALGADVAQPYLWSLAAAALGLLLGLLRERLLRPSEDT